MTGLKRIRVHQELFGGPVLGVETMQCDIVGTETKVVVDKLNLLLGFEVRDFTASKLCEFMCAVVPLKKRLPPEKKMSQ